MSAFPDIEMRFKIQQHYRVPVVAKMCGVNQRTVRRWIAEGRVKSHKIAGARCIPRSELLKLIKSV